MLAAPALGRARLTWLTLTVLAWSTGIYPSIVFGVTAAVFAAHDAAVFQRPVARALLAVVGVAAAGGLVAGLSYDPLAPLVGICIVLLLGTPGRKRPLGALVGGLSYPLYLNHWLGVFVANAAMRPFGLRETAASHVLSAVFSIGFAAALYLCIERPLLRRRAQWYTPAIGRRATFAAYAMMAVGLALGAAFYLAQAARP